MKELTETNSAAAKELDFLGKKLVEKRDLFFIDEKIYHEYYQDLQGMKASFKADPSLDFEDWIEDLTEQLEESKAELEADRKVIMELERKYRDIFLGP